ITAKELCKQPLIFRELGSGTRVVVERTLARKGLYPKPIMTLGSTEAIKRAVAAGMGFGIVSNLTIAFEIAAHRLGVLPVSDLTFCRPLHLLSLRGRHPDPSVKSFLTLLEKHLSKTKK
ncbi:TPA: LysR family transcriptional regulator, partial [Candidatus Sumerlaeota bacterium]|nr:LysR family transcriptional regulator [Candidatus Sumerlaeota bacterium]